MKLKIWVLATVLPETNEPALPAVFADEAAARRYYAEAIRAEWDNVIGRDFEEPYPGDPDDAQRRLRLLAGGEWGSWELSCHDLEINGLTAPRSGLAA